MITVGTDVRVRPQGGGYFSCHPALNDAYIDRLRAIGEPIQLLAREASTKSGASVNELRTEVSPVLITSEIGPKPVRVLRAVMQTLRTPLNCHDTVYVRLPETIGVSLAIGAIARRAQVISHVVALPEALAGPDRRVIARCLSWLTRFIISRSSLVLYVTEETLQKALPPRGVPHGTLSNVILTSDDYAPFPRRLAQKPSYSIVTVGSLNGNGKGVDTVIRAIKTICEAGLDCTLSVIGEGSSRPALEGLALDLGLEDRVIFHGSLSREELFRQLDDADIFALASRSEGLPRAMVEAMAHGLVCVGTDIGGIPELLPDSNLFPPEDHQTLSSVVVEYLGNPQLYCLESERAIGRVKSFEWSLSVRNLAKHAENALSMHDQV